MLRRRWFLTMALASALANAAAQSPTPAPADPVRDAEVAWRQASEQHGADSLPAATAQLALAKARIRVGLAVEATAAAAAALVVFTALGVEHELAAADALLVLGASSGMRGEFEPAAEHYRRSLEIRERLDPPGSPYIQLLRFNLAATLQALSDFRGAIALAEAGIAACKPGVETAALGSFASVAALCRDGLGDYHAAFVEYLRAERILRVTRGPSYPDTLRMAGMAGVAQCRIGQSEQGLQRIADALGEMQSAAGVPAAVQFELESAYAMMRTAYERDATAVQALRDALTRCDDAAIPTVTRHTRRLMLMAMLSDFDADGLDLERARQSMQQLEASLGAEHEQVAGMLVNLGRMLMLAQQDDEALVCLQRAADIFAASPWYLATDRWKVMWGLSRLHRLQGRFAPALAAVERGVGELLHLLDAWALPLDEPQRHEFVAAARAGLDCGLSLSRQLQRSASEQWQLVLAWKVPVSRGLLQPLEWLAAQRDVTAQQLAADIRRAPAEQREQLTARWRQRFAERSSPSSLAEQIAATLAEDQVLIDFFSYGQLLDVSARAPHAEERLLAFVVRAGKPPVVIDLGLLAEVDAAVQQFLQCSARWTRPIDGAAEVVAAAGERLASKLWSPLQALVPASARVCICPDSVVALVPFASLPGREPGTFLLEQHEFCYLASPADLLAQPQPVAAATARTLLAVGDVAYGAPLANATQRDGRRDFGALPSTGVEVDAVAGLLQELGGSSRVLRGDAATAAALRSGVPGASHVHIATHGWYGGSRSLPGVEQRWLFLEARGKALPVDAEAPGAAGGIVLAGANLPGDDGGAALLTIDAMAQLDLHRCELVVLSACETGLGTISAGDGLLGLRRSLRLAGARSSLTAIWRVDDAATQQCMASFYAGLWRQGLAPAAALRTAQLQLLRTARQQHGQALLGTWGAFVIEGRH